MFEHAQHQRIADLLGDLDGRLLRQCQCLFAGGTAISMQLREFRRSDDIDFLCASAEGYRRLRERVFDAGLDGLSRRPLPVLRQPRTDQYGIRAVLGRPEAPIKFEIVREARVNLRAATARISGVPLLSRQDLYAQKLLANADRGLDASTLHRDLIDLCVMHQRWGQVPAASWAKARGAYGASVDRAAEQVAVLLSNPETLRRCLAELDAAPGVEAEVRAALGAFRASRRRRRSGR